MAFKTAGMFARTVQLFQTALSAGRGFGECCSVAMPMPTVIHTVLQQQGELNSCWVRVTSGMFISSNPIAGCVKPAQFELKTPNVGLGGLNPVIG